jgi:Ca2+-binding RTX toxin-like protein
MFTGLTAAGVTFKFDVTATTGDQTIVTGSGADTVTGGTGADTINVGSGADIVVIAAGDSVPTFTGATTVGVVSGIDNVTGFTLGDGSSASSDELQVPGTGAIGAIGTFTTNGTDSTLQLNTGAAVQTHAITSGILTVDDASTFGTAVTLTTTGDVAAVLQYLNTNDIGAAGDTLAFVATISTVPHTYVYTQTTGNAGGDAIDLVGVAATSLIAANATTSGALFIS